MQDTVKEWRKLDEPWQMYNDNIQECMGLFTSTTILDEEWSFPWMDKWVRDLVKERETNILITMLFHLSILVNKCPF